MLLADLGATVIKVGERGGRRHPGLESAEADGVATYYLSINRNKHSMVADFRDPDDVAVIHELFRRSDIAVGELQGWRTDQVRARLRNGAGDQSVAHLPVDQWVRHRRRGRPTRLRPRRTSGIGIDEPHR